MSEITLLIRSAEAGDEQATDRLFALVYNELKLIAINCMARESSDNTLQPTALVHEAYLRLIGPGATREEAGERHWSGHGHFLSAAAEAMRRILIESARRKKRQKRGGDMVRVPVDLDHIAVPELADDLLALDEALSELNVEKPQLAKLVTLRYFGGLTLKETAAVLGIAPRTADSHWAFARAWLLSRMNQDDETTEEENLTNPPN